MELVIVIGLAALVLIVGLIVFYGILWIYEDKR